MVGVPSPAGAIVLPLQVYHVWPKDYLKSTFRSGRLFIDQGETALKCAKPGTGLSVIPIPTMVRANAMIRRILKTDFTFISRVFKP